MRNPFKNTAGTLSLPEGTFHVLDSVAKDFYSVGKDLKGDRRATTWCCRERVPRRENTS